MKQWNEIFKKHGKVFFKTQEDIPKIARLFKKHNIIRVLDLGCGTGRHTVYLAKKGFEMYGFDIAETGRKIAKDWLKKEKLRAKLKTGSIYKKLPYKDDFFDAIVSTNTIHHSRIENIRKAIREIERVLKPNGFVFITVRKRKFRRLWRKNKIIEKYGKQKTRYKIIAPKTYVPTEGGEKGLIHYLFDKKSIRKEFRGFKIDNIWIDSTGRHYCFLAKLKEE